jgi:hypothetical protein
MFVIGIDPGPIPGIVRLQLDANWVGATCNAFRVMDAQALQISPDLIEPVLDMLAQDDQPVVAVERFVVGRRSALSSTPAAGARTRGMVGVVEAWADRNSVRCISRSAAEVKPWATDQRLAVAGLLEPLTNGMRHARDAARHALFCAVKDYGMPDPLSSKAGAR